MADSRVERAVEVLSLLAKCREGREEMERLDGFVGVLVRVLLNGSPRGVQHALSTLNSLCYCNEGMRWQAKREEIEEICLGFLED
uniref:U-box domain-containing protein n=1 Tax=Nelumbo nucifera TaxID=4432 RepID=A0A822Z5R1_NELNU|nr:TPA_asm: hypothetical protein HUJ06_013097 [Nelumbo nucifera]